MFYPLAALSDHAVMLALIDMSWNFKVAGLVLFAGALYVLFCSRRSRDGSHSSRWIPWISLVAGPLLGVLYWLAEIYVLNPTFYQHPADSLSLFTAALFLGTFAGCVSALVFGIALYLSHPRGS